MQRVHIYTNPTDKAALHATLNFNLLRCALYYPSTKFHGKQMDNLRNDATFSKKQKNRLYIVVLERKERNCRKSLNLIVRLYIYTHRSISLVAILSRYNVGDELSNLIVYSKLHKYIYI